MDERLQKALDFSNYMVALNNQKRILQESVYQDLIYYTSGSKFTVNRELICFCSTLVNFKRESFVLIDDNDIPVKIDDINKFLEAIAVTIKNAANNWLEHFFSVLSDSRKPEKSKKRITIRTAKKGITDSKFMISKIGKKMNS